MTWKYNVEVDGVTSTVEIGKPPEEVTPEEHRALVVMMRKANRKPFTLPEAGQGL